jgi:hypothetical protein
VDRTEMFALAKARGWISGKPLTTQQKIAIAAAFTARLTQADVPSVKVGDRMIALPDAVSALMEEL